MKAPTISLTRVQQNVLAAGERRLLDKLCAAMPSWINPDRLTALGMVGSLMIFAGYAASNWAAGWLVLSLGGYVLQWFGDSMDGSLARFRHIERPSYGYFLDHSCDGITVLLILGGLGLSPYIRLDVALTALVGYLLLSVHAFLSAKVTDQLNLTYLAAGPTELRLLLVGLTVAMLLLGPGPGAFGPVSGFDIFVGAVATILLVLFVSHTAKVARQLARAGK
ncbi:CDP-alcohol phosphatidyltransferase family protein [Sphingomonas crusticola]|uniref:CDP-alcohol phosphatidyltransferase family protein n=1 Tax=Sphingomonas crusticola TaxID=1697973 RepID=UPI001F0826B3|nr:CDP-alcohol phosphatidyltransferase family protein [Sphingomonas crusticola]